MYEKFNPRSILLSIIELRKDTDYIDKTQKVNMCNELMEKAVCKNDIKFFYFFTKLRIRGLMQK